MSARSRSSFGGRPASRATPGGRSLGRLRRAAPPRRRDLAEQVARTGRGETGREGFPGEVGDDVQARVVVVIAWRNAAAAAAGRASDRSRAGAPARPRRRPPSRRRPTAPTRPRSRPAPVPAVLGERVEKGIGGRVSAVAAAAPDTRVRGERHEHVEWVVAQAGVEVAQAGHLDCGDLGELRKVEFCQRLGLRHSGDVQDGADLPPFAVELVDQLGERRPVGDVTGDDRRMGTPSDSSVASSGAPGADRPRRPVRTRSWAPSATSHLATSAPMPPVPPVIRTVPCGFQERMVARVSSGAGIRRRP